MVIHTAACRDTVTDMELIATDAIFMLPLCLMLF